MKTTEETQLTVVKEFFLESGFSVTEEELDSLRLVDFGIGNWREEGCGLIDLLRTDLIRITLLILLPNQTLPQHLHPSYEGSCGKEESIRTLKGLFRIYVEGDEARDDLLIPAGKDAYYTARKEIILPENKQFSVPPNTAHWFQAGPDGAVVIAFQNRVNEDHNVFYDPKSDGCPIPHSNTDSE